MVKKNKTTPKKVVPKETEKLLKKFQNEFDVFSKGKLSLVIQLTRIAESKKFPLPISDFQTDNKGQVKGISGANLKRILEDHGITQQLTAEGGRTSRGNMGVMIAYVEFLNGLQEHKKLNLKEVENYWAQEIRQYFNNKPFKISSDSAKSVSSILNDLLAQARKREKLGKGTRYTGILLQQLVAAKLQLITSEINFQIYGASVADAPINRLGDFVINSTSIHCTTRPRLSLNGKM